MSQVLASEAEFTGFIQRHQPSSPDGVLRNPEG